MGGYCSEEGSVQHRLHEAAYDSTQILRHTRLQFSLVAHRGFLLVGTETYAFIVSSYCLRTNDVKRPPASFVCRFLREPPQHIGVMMEHPSNRRQTSASSAPSVVAGTLPPILNRPHQYCHNRWQCSPLPFCL